MDGLLKTVSVTELITALFSLLAATAAAYFGYLANKQKIQNETRSSTASMARTAEQEFRDDLIKQLEDSNLRFDRQMQRLDEREKRIAELVQQIDNYWNEKAELKMRIATLEAELSAAHRKIKDLTAELEKFERKVFYIAPKEGNTPPQAGS